MTAGKTVPLGDLVKIIGGGTPNRKNPEYWNGEIPWATVKDLKGLELSATQESISQEGLTDSAANLIPANTVIVGTRMAVGKALITKHETAINQDLKALICDSNLDARYLLHFIGAKRNHIEQMASGATVKGIKLEVLRDLRIPLLPIKQQKRIAAMLDKADELRRKRRESIAALDSLTQSIFLDLFGDPVTNPKKWEVAKFKDIVDLTTGKLDSNAAVKDGVYPFFTCSRDNFKINTYAFDCEALLLAGNNASADYSVKYYKGKFNAYQRTYVITLKKPGLTYPYMQQVLEMKLLDLKRLSKGTNTKYLTLGILHPILFQIPPKDLQEEFVKRCAAIQTQRTKLLAAQTETENLFTALQQKAFAL